MGSDIDRAGAAHDTRGGVLLLWTRAEEVSPIAHMAHHDGDGRCQFPGMWKFPPKCCSLKFCARASPTALAAPGFC